MESKVERYVENYVVNKNTMALLPVISVKRKLLRELLKCKTFSYFKTSRYYRKKLSQAWF